MDSLVLILMSKWVLCYSYSTHCNHEQAWDHRDTDAGLEGVNDRCPGKTDYELSTPQQLPTHKHPPPTAYLTAHHTSPATANKTRFDLHAGLLTLADQ